MKWTIRGDAATTILSLTITGTVWRNPFSEQWAARVDLCGEGIFFKYDHATKTDAQDSVERFLEKLVAGVPK